MITKLNLIAGGVVVLLTAGAFTIGRGRKPKTNWNAEGWLRLLSGANGTVSTQTGQAGSMVAAPADSNRTQDQAAELIGRTGYLLYR